jgi:exopolysaccharide biosynthesis polyprenyl glycosylphosphotransferase
MFLHRVTSDPNATPRIKPVSDLIALLLASTACATVNQHVVDWGTPLATAVLAAAGWTLVTRVLRRHDFLRGHGFVGDLVLASVLTITATCTMALARALVPAYAEVTALHRFSAVLWVGTLLPRIVIPVVRLLAPDEPRDVLIIGSGPLARHTADEIQRQESARVAVLSFPDEGRNALLPGAHLGTSDDLARVLGERPFHEVYIAGSPLRQWSAMQAAVRTCERLGTPFALPASHFRLDRARPVDDRAFSDGYVHYLSVEHKPYQMAVKRIIDIFVSSCVLLLLSPVLAVVALLIKLGSPGPILFRQERVGLCGRPFHMLKFRSMVVDAEARQRHLMHRNEQAGPVFKIKDDPRVTRVGRVLRRFSIDELPQFINVLRGEMAIVGPRPPLPSEVAKYELWQRRRLSVRPGLTCLWQVSGRNNISFEEWMYLDMRYIDHWSLIEDLKLILKTVPVVVSGRGAS